MSPSPTLLPCPAGQPPLKLTGQPPLRLLVPRTLSAHRRVSTPYPLSGVVSVAVLPPGRKSRSRCPLSALLRKRGALRLLGIVRLSGCGGNPLENPSEMVGKVQRRGGGDRFPALRHRSNGH